MDPADDEPRYSWNQIKRMLRQALANVFLPGLSISSADIGLTPHRQFETAIREEIEGYDERWRPVAPGSYEYNRAESEGYD